MFSDIVISTLATSAPLSLGVPYKIVQLLLKISNFIDKDIFNILNTQSGFGAISGVADSRDLEDLYFAGNEKAKLAVEMFCYKISKTMASYFIPLGA